jgi:peptide/nickel transport system substrate-binding protein
MTVMIQAYFKRVGIEMKVRDIEFNQMLALLNNPQADWQAAGLGQGIGTYPTGEDLYKTGSFGNSGGYSDPVMDRLIDESTDQPGLRGLYDYETYASAQQPVIFLEKEAVTILARKGLRGVRNFVDPAYNYYPDQLYCTEADAP